MFDAWMDHEWIDDGWMAGWMTVDLIIDGWVDDDGLIDDDK